MYMENGYNNNPTPFDISNRPTFTQPINNTPNTQHFLTDNNPINDVLIMPT